MTEQQIKALEDKGFKRWTKGNHDRLYVDAKELGLKCTYYKTGNISNAIFQGERISNCEARRMKAAKTYVDVKTGTLHGTYSPMTNAARELMEA